MWSISRMLTTVGLGIGVLNEWLAVNFFQPMIQHDQHNHEADSRRVQVRGVGYPGDLVLPGSLHSPERGQPAKCDCLVDSRRLVLRDWPSFYLSMRQLNQTLSSVFYASSLQTISTQNPFSQQSGLCVSSLCSNFSAYLIGSAGNINGLDVALAFQKADGYDVINGGAKCLGGGDPLDIPRAWLAANGFFDAAIAPDSWSSAVRCPSAPAVCDYDTLISTAVSAMQATVNQNFAGIARECQAVPMVWFAIIEQLVALCLIVAQGLTFVSFGCAILFAFFDGPNRSRWQSSTSGWHCLYKAS